MSASEELVESDEVAIRLTHLLAVDGDHVVVHPVVDSWLALGCTALCNLALVVREEQVETSAMDVELIAEVLLTHSRALKMPARETLAPRRWPMHDMFRLCLLPESKVACIALLVLSVELACRFKQLVDITSGKDTIVELLGIFLDIEIDTTFAHISIASIENLLHIGNLLDDVARSVRLDAWRKHVERIHGLVVAVEIILHHLHRFFLLQTCLLGNLVLALIGIVLKVTHIGDVAAVAHLIADVLEIAIENIESDGRTSMTKMSVAIDSRTAHIHAHMIRDNRLERLLCAAQSIVNV